MTELRLRPFFFGPDDALFGCHHPPEGGDLGHGVVLCPPFGHEALQFHRALAQLAVHLARAGHAVLRFDPYGSGDSAGEGEETRLARWIDDVESAVDALRAAEPGLRRVSLAGLRLGASAAVLAAARRNARAPGDVHGLALWDPVVLGPRFLAQLDALHERVLRVAHVLPTDVDRIDRAGSARVGFPVPAAFVDELRALDLTAAPPVVARARLLRSHPQDDPTALADALRAAGAETAVHAQLEPELWTWEEDVGRQLVPLPLLRTLVEGLGP